MKKLEAFIEPAQFDALKVALLSHGVVSIAASPLRRYGSAQVRKEFYRGMDVIIDYRDELKLELTLFEHQVANVIDVIQAVAPKARIALFDMVNIAGYSAAEEAGAPDRQPAASLRIAS